MTQTLLKKLRRHHQEHLLRWWGELNADDRRSLVRQIEAVDFELVKRLFQRHGDSSGAATGESPAERAGRAGPPAALVRLPASDDDATERTAAARHGRELLATGKVGAILVAGGQGTRLGFPKPKGMFPIGPVSGNSLFQILAEQLLTRSRRAGVAIPYYVMTSDATHAKTVAFFEEHEHFGLDGDEVFFFQQGNMPAVDAVTGRLLMAGKSALCASPDGHGGMLAALAAADLLEEMRRRGIEYLFYHQVDNPTAIVCDPAFLGFHTLRNSEMSTKVVSKSSAEERMGIVVDVDGQTQIIEYIHVPPDVARKRDETGGLLLWAGSTAIHVFNREFLERVVVDASKLPFQVAQKEVPYIDEDGETITPAKANALKFERFIFDAMPLAEHALVVEADRAAEFNPVKNCEGDDSPETARRAMCANFAGWLKAAGARVADDATIEISPLFALDAEEVRGKVDTSTEYTGDTYLR